MLAKSIAMTATAGEALDYLHHDRGGARTSERVEWAENVNCVEASPEEIEKIWTQLVNDAGEIKRQAGGSSRGRKLEKPIGHYVLAWAPDERPSREEMIETAKHCMSKLGYRKCMYRIVAHTDRDHPHVHVLVCRVNPETGRAEGRKNDGDKLMQWATDFERAQGRIRVIGRYEDRINRSRRSRQKRNGETPTPNTPEQNRRRLERRHKRRTTRDAIGRPVVLTAPERQEWRKVMTFAKPTAAQPAPTAEQPHVDDGTSTRRAQRADLKRGQLTKRLGDQEKRATLLEDTAAARTTKATPTRTIPPPMPARPRLARIEIVNPTPRPEPARTIPPPMPARPRLGQIEIVNPAPRPEPTRTVPPPMPARPRLGQIEIVNPAPRPEPTRTVPPPMPARPRLGQIEIV